MRKIVNLKSILYVVMFIMAMTLGGCSDKKNDDAIITFNKSWNDADTTTEDTQTPEETESYKNEYMIVNINSSDEVIRVYRYSNGMEYQYYYGMSTEFCNKYGNHTAIANFSEGDVVSISGTDDNGKLTKVQKSDAVWVYDEVSKFSFADEGKVLSIGDSNYEIARNTFIFSGKDIVEYDAISDNDTLSVVGVDKKVLSVVVTTGHGTLKLSNTKLFEGSYLQLGDDIFTEITKNMEIEVPEGKYKLTVANNGWGGTKEIEIKRGETTRVDLDKMKGSGPKKGKILFEVDVANARIFVDNKEVEAGKVIKLTYGAHSLIVMAEGYTTWNKTLYVNSKEATVIVTLEGSESDSGSNGSSNSSSNNSGNSSNNSNSNNSGNSSNSSNSSNSGNSSNSSDNSQNSGSHRDPSSEHQAPETPTPSHDSTQSTQSGGTTQSTQSGGTTQSTQSGGTTQGTQPDSDSTRTTSADLMKDYLSTIADLLDFGD